MALVRRGEQAVGSALRAHTEIQKGELAKASNTLLDVKMDGIKLAKEAEELMNRIQAVENHYIQREQALARKVGQLLEEKQRLSKQKMEIEAELSHKRSELRRQRQSLDNAEENLSSAKKKQEEAEGNKNAMIVASVATGVGGLVFSIATLGLGTPIAAAAVVGCAISASNYADQQKQAEREIQHFSHVIRVTEHEIESCSKRISQITSTTDSLTQQIKEQQQKATCYHEEQGEMRKLIVFVKEAQVYWNEFADATKHGAGRADLIQKLTKRAQEKRWFGFLARQSGKRQAMNFLEAWEEVKTKLQSGSEHLFEIDFECSYCSCTFRSLPYVHNSKLICSSCHYYYR